jgi:amidophosphoribosyltransferase
MCGILGILDPDRPVAAALYRGGLALQHRGQDGAGILTFDGRFHRHTGLGLMLDVFRDQAADQFPGHVGLTHLRYATSGTGGRSECQPFVLMHPYGLALAHNGNLTNDTALRERLETHGRRLVNSGSDSETLLHVFADALGRADAARPTVEDLFRAAQLTMATVEGAYAVLIVIAGVGLLGFRDPHGLRPLVLGRRGGAIVLASESVALDAVDAEWVRDVAPGEVIFVDAAGGLHATHVMPARPAHCAFEYIYLARPESAIDGRSVAEVRERLGASLARREREAGADAVDVAFDVPTSAEDAAVAFAREAGVPYRRGIRKNAYCHRSFIAASPALRQAMAGNKFHFDRRVIAGKRLAVVDDSIVRGTTARALLDQLRARGAAHITLLSAAPPVRHPCVYGIDMALRAELVARDAEPETLAEQLGADRVAYQRLEDLVEALDGLSPCLACFNGCYPTGISAEDLARIEDGRLGLRRSKGHVMAPLAPPPPALGTRPR